jgi:hypothetical protein
MKRAILALVVLAVIVVASVVLVNRHSPPPPSSSSSPDVSHTIKSTPATMAILKSTFIKYKLHYKEMATRDKLTWGQLLQPKGPNLPLIAYDALDHRDWALAAFSLALPASYKAGVSFQDGGNMGIFNKVGSGRWKMIGSPGFPLCAKDVPSVVAHLWGLNKPPACN